MADFGPRMTGDFEPQGYRLLATLLLVVLVALGLVVLAGNTVWWALIIVGGMVIYVIVRLLLAVEANTHRLTDSLNHLARGIDRVTSQLDEIKESLLLSDDAKSVAYREKDRQTLRQAIEEELARNDFEAASTLADQLEMRFGYREMADQVRRRIRRLQEQKYQQSLAMELAKIGDLLAGCEWATAEQEIHRLSETYPDAEEIRALPTRLDQAKAQRKKLLLGQWDQAVQRDDIDRGIAILKDLDAYLSAAEVAALQESARGVFKTKLHNLGIQFSMLVMEKEWARALEVGEEIVTEFPNSKMADEIKQSIQALRSKAAGAE